MAGDVTILSHDNSPSQYAVQAVIQLFSFAYVLINLAIDLLYTVLDPRIRY